jgi:hypothetical protein
MVEIEILEMVLLKFIVKCGETLNKGTLNGGSGILCDSSMN